MSTNLKQLNKPKKHDQFNKLSNKPELVERLIKISRVSKRTMTHGPF